MAKIDIFSVTLKDDETCRVKCNSEDYGEYNGELIIPGSFTINGETKPVSEIEADGFSAWSGITSVVLPDNEITLTIGAKAFKSCALTTVIIPGLCTEMFNLPEESEGNPFDDTPFMDIPVITNYSVIEERAIQEVFEAKCGITPTINEPTDLQFTELEDGNSWAVSLATESSYFSRIPSSYCGKNVIKISDCGFANCSNSEIIIPASIISIGAGAFSGCSLLEKISLPFVGNKCYTRYTYPQYGFGYIFGETPYEGAQEVMQQIVSSAGTTPISYYIPTSLRTVLITKHDYIQPYTFVNCTMLETIDLNTTVATIGPSAFNGCTNLSSINIPTSISSINDYTFCNCNELTEITLPGSLTTIRESAFMNCNKLVSLSIPANVTTLGKNCFTGCSALTELSIPVSVTALGVNCFTGCSNQIAIYDYPELINLSNYNQYIESGKDACIKHKVNYGYSADYNSIVVTGYTANMLTETDTELSILAECADKPVTTIETQAFKDCTVVKKVVIPSSVETINNYAFAGCTSLQYIQMTGRSGAEVIALNDQLIADPDAQYWRNKAADPSVSSKYLVKSHKEGAVASAVAVYDTSGRKISDAYLQKADTTLETWTFKLANGTIVTKTVYTK